MLIFIVKLIVESTLLVWKVHVQFMDRRNASEPQSIVDIALRRGKSCGQWTVLIGSSLGGKNIDSPAARRGASGSLAGFVCDCFEEKHAGVLRYAKIDVIRLLSERRKQKIR